MFLSLVLRGGPLLLILLHPLHSPCNRKQESRLISDVCDNCKTGNTSRRPNSTIKEYRIDNKMSRIWTFKWPCPGRIPGSSFCSCYHPSISLLPKPSYSIQEYDDRDNHTPEFGGCEDYPCVVFSFLLLIATTHPQQWFLDLLIGSVTTYGSRSWIHRTANTPILEYFLFHGPDVHPNDSKHIIIQNGPFDPIRHQYRGFHPPTTPLALTFNHIVMDGLTLGKQLDISQKPLEPLGLIPKPSKLAPSCSAQAVSP